MVDNTDSIMRGASMIGEEISIEQARAIADVDFPQSAIGNGAPFVDFHGNVIGTRAYVRWFLDGAGRGVWGHLGGAHWVPFRNTKR